MASLAPERTGGTTIADPVAASGVNLGESADVSEEGLRSQIAEMGVAGTRGPQTRR